VADKIMLNPYGSVDLHGLSSNTRFYKNALDKLGLEMQVVKVGSFKSAVEPYTNTEMSAANREQVKVFLQSVWDNLASEIAQSRHLPTDSINAIADQFAGLQTTSKIRSLNLVDTLVYKDETDSILNKLVADNKKAVKVGHYTFTKKNNKSKRDKNKIAIIYADGEIAEDGDINAAAMAKICKTLANDNSIKAVVLRVNSPGGSAFESENIWRALTKLKAKKPLVVSMGNYAASGVSPHLTAYFAVA
jgi:protease-4